MKTSTERPEVPIEEQKLPMDEHSRVMRVLEQEIPESQMYYHLTPTERDYVLASLLELQRIQRAEPVARAAERDADISPCCQEWHTCTKRCAPLAENWRMAAKAAEAKLALVKKGLREPTKEMVRAAGFIPLPSYKGQAHEMAYDIVSESDVTEIINAAGAELLRQIEEE